MGCKNESVSEIGLFFDLVLGEVCKNFSRILVEKEVETIVVPIC